MVDMHISQQLEGHTTREDTPDVLPGFGEGGEGGGEAERRGSSIERSRMGITDFLAVVTILQYDISELIRDLPICNQSRMK
jgi:hypothetical protein